MSKLKGFLDGKKSYIVSVAMFVLGGLQAVGVEVPNEVYAILGGLLGASLRSGINKE